MDTMQMGYSIAAVLAVVTVALGAWWVVHRARTPTAPRQGSPVLATGWQFYTRPTELEPPGTVFRIDASKVRYIVDTLEVPIQKGAEAAGHLEETVLAKVGVVARFLGMDGPRLDLEATTSERFTFELQGVSRQYVDDVDLDSVLKPWIQGLEERVGSRYFVIRESVAGREITYRLSRNQVDNLGGEASLASVASLDGTIRSEKATSLYLLRQAFRRPLRVMFLAEELRPHRRGLSDDARPLRQPVSAPLEWIEFEDV